MALKVWYQLDAGGVNPEGGNALNFFTGFFRRGQKPRFYEESCIQCFLCWVFCPDSAIIVENEKIVGVNHDYCKGCGICVNQCPVAHEPRPLAMVDEDFEL